jgi:hypothetical protein
MITVMHTFNFIRPRTLTRYMLVSRGPSMISVSVLYKYSPTTAGPICGDVGCSIDYIVTHCVSVTVMLTPWPSLPRLVDRGGIVRYFLYERAGLFLRYHISCTMYVSTRKTPVSEYTQRPLLLAPSHIQSRICVTR